MARSGLNNGFYFDPDIFLSYTQEESVFDDNIITSGILTMSQEIANAIATSSNVFTIPFYKPLSGSEENNDGETDIVSETLSGGKQTGMSFRRWASWTDKDFTRELTGTQPLADCATKVAGYWREKNQERLLGILQALSKNTSLTNHVTSVAVTEEDTDPTSANQISTDLILDAMQKALGSRQKNLTTIFMHSIVYNQLVKANLVNNIQTVDNANTKSPYPGTILGLNIIVCDDITTEVDSTTGLTNYTTIIAGNDLLLTAPARVDVPVEFERAAKVKGGTNSLISRIGMVIHPNGFDYAVSSVSKESPTNAELFNSAYYTLKVDEKLIPLVMITTN